MANEQDPAFLRRRRAIVQGSCTRVKTFIDTIQLVTPEIILQLRTRSNKLDQFWSEYQNVQIQLEQIDENEAGHRVNFEEAFYTLTVRIEGLLNPPALPQGLVAPPPSNEIDVPRSLTHVRLPKLDLPSFSGKYEEWFPFFDSFTSIIHSNESISDVQKLQYLKGCLKDEASTVVRN